MRHVLAPSLRVKRLSPLSLFLAALCLVSGWSVTARANFGSSDPADWARNRCVARNVMVAGLLTAPAGLVMLTEHERPGRLALGSTLIVASAGTLATGMGLRIRQPGSPTGVNSDYAEWARNGCMLRTVAIYGGPMTLLGIYVIANGRDALRNGFGKPVARIMMMTGAAMTALGLTMTLYGSIRVRRRDGQPAMDLGAPLIGLPVRGGSLSLGIGSLGFSGDF